MPRARRCAGPWSTKAGRYDFSSLEPFARAARENGIEVIWDLFHYGYPQDVDIWGAAFPERFAEYCYAVARYLGRERRGALCHAGQRAVLHGLCGR